MKPNIILAENLPENEEVYLKKDILGWRVVHPIRDKENKIVWKNLLFGGWRNLVFSILIFLLIVFALFAYNHDITTIENHYKEIADNPFEFCRGMFRDNVGVNNPFKINFTLENDI